MEGSYIGHGLGIAADGLACVSDFGQSEVQDLGVPTFGDKDVRRLDVAMDDPFGVRRIERIGDFDGHPSQRSISRGPPSIRRLSVVPSRYSMAMKDWPSCFPIS